MKLRRQITFVVSVFTLLVTLTKSPLNAQNIYGSLVGTVTDPTGSVVTGASVVLTNIGTNERHEATADTTGNYRIVNLAPADYRLEVSGTGFKRMTREPIAIQVGAQVRINPVLQIGAATEIVEVTSATPLLETEQGTVSNVVEGTVVQEMPLNGRNTMNLIALTPGVVPQSETSGSPVVNQTRVTDIYGWGNYQIGGAIAGEDAMYIDGAPINAFGQNSVALVPTQDSIQEFRVATNSVSPEFGHFAGGVIQMTTKSGSNTWHGTAYEFARNTILNANNFFSNFNKQPRNPFHQNQFGALLSGPVKKDKAFFLFSWESTRLSIGIPTSTNMPTANMNAGKFYGKTLTASAAPAGCITNGLVDAGGKYAQVDPSCFDPTAVKMAKYFPSPNATGGTNYFTVVKIPNTANEYVSRVDYSLSNRQSIFARFSYWHLEDTNNQIVLPVYGPTVRTTPGYTYSAVIGDTFTVNPTTILDIRASYMRQYFSHKPGALSVGGIDESQFGPAFAAMGPKMSSRLLPSLQFQGSNGLYNMIGTNANSSDMNNTIALDPNLTKILGRHSLKFGGEVRYLDRTGFGTNLFPSGFGLFNSSTLGDEYAAFLLGRFLNYQIITDQPTTAFSYYQGYYVSDTWQATRNLTLTLGARWELPGGIAEKKDRTTVLLPNTVDPVTGVLGTAALTNSSLYSSRSMVPVRHNLFAPRVGFAQRLANDTVIRGGYGLNYLPNDLPFGVMPYNSPVNFATTINTVSSYHGLSDPFNVLGGGTFRQPVGRTDPNWTKGLLNQVVLGPVPQGMKYPYTQQWNLDFSKQWKGDWATEISYVGAKGTHLVGQGANNPNIYEYQGLNELSSVYYPTLQAMQTGGASQTALIAYGQSHRPYPQYQDYVNTAAYIGSTSYQAMYAKLEKRFRSGGVVHANYAWAKNLGDADDIHLGSGFIQDFNNMHAERSLLFHDVRHRLVVSYVLNMPFGKGQKFAGNPRPAVNAVVGGWSASGTTTFQTGFPLQMTHNGNLLTQFLGAGTLRPNYAEGCPKTVSGTRYERFISKTWFNAACFTFPGNFAFGNESRVDSSLRAQGVENFDFAVSKRTSIKERANLMFRAEFFNIFNHTQFAAPGTTLAGGNYNQVTAQYNQPRLVQVSLRLEF